MIEEKPYQRIKNSISIIHYGTTHAGAEFTTGQKPRSPYCPHCGLSKDKGESSKFCVYKPKQYKCLDCGETGSVIDYVQAHKGFSKESETIKYLNKLYGGLQQPITPIIPTDNTSNDDEKRKANAVDEILKNSSYVSPDELTEILKRREFGELAKIGAKILRSQRICKDNYYKNTEQLKSKYALVVPIKDNDGNTPALQKIGTTKPFSKRCFGKMKGYYLATPLEEKYPELIVVESFFCAVALACVGYNAIAIFSTSNTKNIELIKEKFNDREIYLWLDAGEDDKTKKCIEEHAIHGVFWDSNIKKGFDINDLLESSCDGFSDEIRKYIEKSLPKKKKQPVSFVEPDTSKYKKFEHLAKDIRELKEKEVLLFSAPTGTGKTFFIAQEIVRLCCTTDKLITVFTNSINSVDNIYNEVRSAARSQGIDSLDVTKNVLGKVADNENYNSKHIGRVAIATYYSLGRKGHTNAQKVSVSDIDDPRRQLINGDRILFCDEIQSLVEFCKVNEPLAARYYRNKDGYRKIQKCQVNTKNKDACANCVMAYKRMPPDEKFKKSHFPGSFFEEGRENHQKCELITELFDDLWSINTYDNCDQGLFTKMLEENINYELDKPRDVDNEKENDVIFAEYLSDLLSKLKYPQISMSMPTLKKTEQPIAPSEALKIDKSQRRKQVKFYPQACQVPHLKGYDILPLLQMLQASKIVMCSATIPDDTTKLLQDVLPKKNWSFRLEKVDKDIVQFSAIFLTTKETLSQHTLVALAKILDEETIIVAKTKTEANAIYWSATEKCKLYDGGQFIETIHGKTEKGEKKILVTYLRSTLLTGLNFPDKNVMILDCNSFFPQIICTAKTKEARRAEMLKKLQLLITQAIGRLLRTTPEKMKIGVDDRNIIFVLHGIPNDLELELDDRLFTRKKVIPEMFVTKKKPYESLRDAIDEARRFFQVSDYQAKEKEEQKQHASKQYKKFGRSALSQDQRKLVQTPNEKRFQKLMDKAQEHNGTWREFCISANMPRLKKNGNINIRQEKKLRKVIENK